MEGPRCIENKLPETPLTQDEEDTCRFVLLDSCQEILIASYNDRNLHGGSVYVGFAGVAVALMHYARAADAAGSGTQLATDASYLGCSQEAVKVCQMASPPHASASKTSGVTFLEGLPGLLATTAACLLNDQGPGSNEWEAAVVQLVGMGVPGGPVGQLPADECDLLYGRAGYLYALLFVQKQLKSQAVPHSLIKRLVKEILDEGVRGAAKAGWPGLMYRWQDSLYLGMGHGVAGIVLVLLHAMHVVEELDREHEQTSGVAAGTTYQGAIVQAIQSLVDARFSSGNLPISAGSTSDRLVQLCHGAPGLIMLLSRALEVFPQKHIAWLPALRQAAEVVWERGLLLKGPGLCHGISGNAYALLSAWRALLLAAEDRSGAELQLVRAKRMALYAAQHWKALFTYPDRPASLFEGLAGLTCLLADLKLADLSAVRCPGVEL